MALLVLAAISGTTAMAKAKEPATSTTTAPKASTKQCAKEVVADWYDDGRVGKIYPLHCYRDAIASLQPDVIDYSNAGEEIGRALAFAKQGKPDPGGHDPTPATTSTGKTGTGKTGTGKTGTGKTGTGKTGTGKTGTGNTGTQSTNETVDTSAPSSVPTPLLVLGGLAVVLLGAGGAGYLRRRLGNDGDNEADDDGSPPASA
jgi:cobalamin biosynthesis Mg chelatase CobN